MEIKKAFLHLRPAAVGFTLSLIFLAVIPGYAYASKQVTYGGLLYPVKKGIEKIELSLANTAGKKQEVKEKFIARRLAEAEVLSSKEQQNENEPLIKTINEATKLQKEVKEEKKDAKEIRDREKKLAVLSEIARNVGIEASEELVDSVAEALEAVKTPRGREKRNNFDKPERGFTGFPEAGNMPESIGDEESSDDEGEGEEDKNYSKRTQPVEVRQSYEELKQAVNTLWDDLREDEYEEEDMEELSAKLESKLEKAGAAIEKENLGAAAGLMKATEALTNNAKYFMKWKETADYADDGKNNKKKKNKNIKNSDYADDEDDTDKVDDKKEEEEDEDDEDDEEEEDDKNSWLKYWKKDD